MLAWFPYLLNFLNASITLEHYFVLWGWLRLDAGQFEASASWSWSRRQGWRLNPPLWLPDKEIRALWKEAGQHRRASEMLSWKAHCRPSTHPAFPEYLTTKTANNRIPVSNKTLLVYPKVYLPHLQMYAFVTKPLPINPATRSRTK